VPYSVATSRRCLAGRRAQPRAHDRPPTVAPMPRPCSAPANPRSLLHRSAYCSQHPQRWSHGRQSRPPWQQQPRYPDAWRGQQRGTKQHAVHSGWLHTTASKALAPRTSPDGAAGQRAAAPIATRASFDILGEGLGRVLAPVEREQSTPWIHSVSWVRRLKIFPALDREGSIWLSRFPARREELPVREPSRSLD